jgi:hypothetical protein
MQKQRNLGHLKVHLLIDGMDITNEAKEGLGDIWQEKIYSYSLTDWTTKKMILPSDIKLGGKVYVGFRYNPKSKWILDKKDEIFRILKNRETGEEYDVKLINRPKYYNYETTDGKKMQSVGVSCGNHSISFFINSFCQYFMKNEQCKFCGLVPTQKKFRDTVKLKKVSQVKETMNKILEMGDPVDFVQFSGGSKYDHDLEVREYIPHLSKWSMKN